MIIEKNYRFTRQTKNRTSTRRIIIHHSASGDVSSETIHQWHLQRGWIGIGYHFVVRRNGDIERGRPESTIGAHAGPGANPDSIGICLTGNFEHEAPTEAQVRALSELIRHLYSKYSAIPVEGHSDHMNTLCPGRLFPWDKLRQFLTATPDAVTLQVNGRKVNVKTRIVNSRTEAYIGTQWLPVRHIAEMLGGDVNWNQATRTVEITI